MSSTQSKVTVNVTRSTSSYTTKYNSIFTAVDAEGNQLGSTKISGTIAKDQVITIEIDNPGKDAVIDVHWATGSNV